MIDVVCDTKIIQRVSDADRFMCVCMCLCVREKNESIYSKCFQVHLINSDTYKHRGKHTSTIPWHLCSRYVLESGLPESGVTDCRQAKHFLVSALLLLSEATISSDTAGRSPSRNHIRERAEGVTNHITSTDSLQSLCSLDPVLRLCPYLSEWRFMVWPVGGRVMW